MYTEARLQGDPLTQDLVEPHTELITRSETVRVGQRRTWREAIVAQAAVDTVNIRLDVTTRAFSSQLVFTEQGRRETPRFRRYLPSGVHEVVRMALGKQVSAMRSWPGSLAGEPEAELQSFGPQIAGLLTEGDTALQSRVDAAARRADYRVREIATLVDDVNAVRVSTMGSLLQRGAKLGMTRDWAESFFRRAERDVSVPSGGEGGGEA